MAPEDSRIAKILRSTLTVGAFTALSRVLGMVREMLQSRMIGAGVEQSAFTLAFAIPNMARKLFGEGALTAAFVPVFKREMESGAHERAERLARAVMTMSLVMLTAIVALVFLGLESVVAWRRELELSGRTLLTIRLVKTLLPYMIFICGAAFGMGVLNALGRFKASSAMPCLLNVMWIGALLFLCFNPELRLDQRIHRVAMAILAAGAVQFAFMAWRMRRAGVSPVPLFEGWRDANVRRVWSNTAIAAVGAGAVQMNYMLDQVLAQCAAPWAAGVIGYAERLMDLPLGIVGVAFGTVLLPAFAGFFARGDLDGARNALSSSVRSLLFVMLPAAAGLFALAPEITAVIYQGRAFDEIATVRVSRSLAVYSLGLRSLVSGAERHEDAAAGVALYGCSQRRAQHRRRCPAAGRMAACGAGRFDGFLRRDGMRAADGAGAPQERSAGFGRRRGGCRQDDRRGNGDGGGVAESQAGVRGFRGRCFAAGAGCRRSVALRDPGVRLFQTQDIVFRIDEKGKGVMRLSSFFSPDSSEVSGCVR